MDYDDLRPWPVGHRCFCNNGAGRINVGVGIITVFWPMGTTPVSAIVPMLYILGIPYSICTACGKKWHTLPSVLCAQHPGIGELLDYLNLSGKTYGCIPYQDIALPFALKIQSMDNATNALRGAYELDICTAVTYRGKLRGTSNAV